MASDKQFDALIGISRNMERSLKAIEESLKAGSGPGGSSKTKGAAGVLGAMGADLESLIAAVAVSTFDESKGDAIITFSEKLVDVANKVTSSTAKDFGEFATGLGKAFDVLLDVMSPVKMIKLFLASKILFGGKKPLLNTIVSGMNNAFKDLDGENAAKGAKAIKFMGEGLLSLTKAMGGLILMGIASPLVMLGALVARGIASLFVGIGARSKQLEKGAQSFKTMGQGIVWLTTGLATLTLAVMLIGPAKILEGIVVISAFALLFTTIGLVSGPIRRGARAIALVGLALFGFAAGLASYMLAIIMATPAMVLAGIVTIAGFAIVFALLGRASKSVATGALLLIGMSVALFLFSGGLMIFGLALKLFDLESAVLGAILIAELGLAMAILGRFSKQITSGAIVMAEMGVGLLLFSAGVMLFGLAVKIWSAPQALVGAIVIGALGLAFAGVGLVAGLVAAGIPVIGGMGVALMLFSAGIVVYAGAIKLLSAMFDNLAEAGVVAAGILVGMGLAFVTIGFGAPLIIAGAAAVGAMGGSLLMFSLGLVVFAIAVKILHAMFDDLLEAGKVAAGILLGLGAAFLLIGIGAGLIIAGAVAVGFMGGSLLIFSIGLLAFAGALKMASDFIGMESLVSTTSGILIGLGLSYSLLGVMSPLIIMGSVSVITMGASMLAFSLGMLALVGAAKVGMEALGTDPEKLGSSLGSILSGIGGEISKIGIMLPLIVLGSASMILMGASLLTVGVGLLAFGGALSLLNSQGLIIEETDDKGNKKEKIKGIGILSSLATEFGKVGWTFLTTWAIAGVAASIGMGVSLLSIGVGLSTAAAALEKVPDMSKFVDNLFAKETGLIPSMARAFGDIGKEYGGSLLSSFMGADPVSMGMRTVRGMGGALQEIAGGIAAFSNFSEFPILAPDPNDPSKLVYDTVDVFGKVIPGIREQLPSLLTALASTFAEIGNLYGGTEGGWFKKGDPSPVRKGIDAVSGLGGILQELAGGIVAFANFEEFPVQVPDSSDPSKLMYQSVNLWEVIGKMKTTLLGSSASVDGGGLIFALADVFAEIGKQYGGEEGGWFSSGDPSPVRKGIDAISGLGKELESVVGSIVKFANFEEFPVLVPDADDPSKLIYKSVNLNDVIPTMQKVLFGDGSIEGGGLIMSLADMFATIGDRYGEKEGGWFSSGSPSPVRKGIDAISGLGKELESVVGSIVKFANFEEFAIQIPDPNNPEKLIYKSVNLFEIVPKMTKMLAGDLKVDTSGKVSGSSGLLMSLANIFASIGASFSGGFTSNGSVKAGVDAVQGIGKVLSDIAGGIIAFGEIERGIPIYDSKGNIKEYKPFDMNKIKATITNVLEMIPEVFANLDVEQMEKSTEIAKKARPLADSIARIGESLQKLMIDEKDQKKKKSIVGDLGPALKTFIEDTNDLVINDEKVKQLDNLAKTLEKLSKLGDGLKKFSDSLNSTTKSFVSFTPVFDKFAIKLDHFSRFEESFSNLVKNQSKYKFDQFSKSMGTLKDNVNAFNVEHLKLTDSMMKSLAILSKDPSALGSVIKDSIEESFKQLVEAIKELSEELKPVQPTVSPQPVNEPAPSKSEDKTQPTPQTPSITKKELTDAFKSALSIYSENGRLKIVGE